MFVKCAHSVFACRVTWGVLCLWTALQILRLYQDSLIARLATLLDLPELFHIGAHIRPRPAYTISLADVRWLH